MKQTPGARIFFLECTIRHHVQWAGHETTSSRLLFTTFQGRFQEGPETHGDRLWKVGKVSRPLQQLTPFYSRCHKARKNTKLLDIRKQYRKQRKQYQIFIPHSRLICQTCRRLCHTTIGLLNDSRHGSGKEWNLTKAGVTIISGDKWNPTIVANKCRRSCREKNAEESMNIEQNPRVTVKHITDELAVIGEFFSLETVGRIL